MPESSIGEWLALLRDPLDTQKTLTRLPFAHAADIEPFMGQDWGVLVSDAGTLFPYYGSMVFFERTAEVTSLFERTRTELSRCGLCGTYALVGENSSSAIDPGDGLFSPGQVNSYDETLVEAPLWRALERRVFGRWAERMPDPSAGVILDFGCGTGRCLQEYSKRSFRMIGVDASYAMLCAAAAANRAQGCLLLLCSATRLPLKDGSIAGCTSFGTLHHLANPDRALRELYRVLKCGGLLMALEPNRTPLRFLFDAVNRVFPLWEEEAGEGKLLSRRDLLRSNSGRWDWEFHYTVFVLPQLLSLMGDPGWIRRAIRASDWLGCIPFLRSLGGLLLFTARKRR